MRIHVRAVIASVLVLLSPIGCGEKDPARDAGSAGTDSGAPPNESDASASGDTGTSGADAGDLDAGPPVDPGTEQDLVAFCDQLSVAVCDAYLACKHLDQAQHADCKAGGKRECALSGPRAAVRDGKRLFDRNAAKACLAAATGATCGKNLAACAGLFRPNTALGASCFSSGDCKSALCKLGGFCSGTCAASDGNKVGDPCSPSKGCDLTTGFCKPPPPSDGGAPAQTVCVAYLKNEEPCYSATTTVTDRCNPLTSFCDVGSTQTCLPRKASGGACLSTSECDAKLFCKLTPGAPKGSCTARLAEGAPCNPSKYDECAELLFCDGISKACAPFTRKLGQSCTQSVQSCLSSHCKGATSTTPGTCTAFVAAGSACDPKLRITQCAFGSFCDSTTSKCVAAAGVGGTCASPVESPCRELLRCQNGKCQPLGKAGEDCTTAMRTASCANGLYCEATGLLCAATKAANAPCRDARECASGVCEPDTQKCTAVCTY